MMKRAMWATVAVLLTVALVAPQFAVAADEDPLQEVCVADKNAKVTVNGFACKPLKDTKVSDFVFKGLADAGTTNTNKNKANVTPASVVQFRGLNTLGISAARIDFDVGGINPPHTHPRATELLGVLKGELYVGFVVSIGTTNTLFATTIYPGELFVFPRGLVHFQLNVGKTPALAIAALSSQNPGVQQVAPALFTSDPLINKEVLKKGFRIDDKIVDLIRKNFST